VCMKCGVKAKAGSDVTVCKRCGRVSYCSIACRTADSSAHRSVCPFLRRCTSESHLQEANWGLTSGIEALAASARTAEHAALTSWACVRVAAEAASVALDGAACVGLSAPLTLQNALRLLSLQRPPLLELRVDGPPLIVHVPGAAAIEAAAPAAAWTMLPYTPQLHLHLVGPDLQPSSRSCLISGLNSTVTCCASSYESFRAGNQPPPDVIVGLNMGLSCLDYNWVPSLHAMVLGLKPDQRLPIAFATASYEELLEEVLLLQQHCAFKLAESCENCWGWPLLLQSGTTGCDCYRKSSWLCVGTIGAQDGRKKQRSDA
jgi:hypothetical protein